MTTVAFKKAYQRFTLVAAPYLHIEDEQHYTEALELVEEFLENAEDSADDPRNWFIDLLARAIQTYENNQTDLVTFEERALGQPADIATLRLLIDQHKLSLSDLPEIGTKSMVSRVLSGERDLSKKHIAALSERFKISPNLFF